MSDLEERVAFLEVALEDVHLSLHASRVAITILSTCINAQGGDREMLKKAFLEGSSKASPIKFEFPVEEGYEEKLKSRILELL
ncbi:hypothetical protein GKQ23_13695 [Erwinia sp. E602]|uniref:hypothetical protein n=1 Tax=Erwinia sp. E602 TaxID=2675378 RepID=UPI001BAB8B0C|nr:hypothetical protein [Erwinia sp. E602]QUG75985.1 hypothetical protein GKQ23_13695 [Erwinia sp. E602]